MSEMQRNKGIIKRLSTKENLKEVYEKLIADGKHENKWDELNEDGTPRWIDSEDYTIVSGCLFDISGAPDMSDDYDDVNEATRLNETDYQVHAYYYNGGASFNEMLEESIPKADAAYEDKKEEWKDTTGVQIRIVLSKYDDESVKYTYTGSLDGLLSEDDAGCYGYESAQLEAADRVDGDNSRWEDWQVETVEYLAK